MNKSKLLLITALISISFFSCGRNQNTNNKNQKDYSLIEPADTVGAVVGDWIVQRELADPQRLNPITVQDASGQEFSLYHRI